MYAACVEALKPAKNKLKPGNKVGEVFDIHADVFDSLGYKKSRMNACGYSLGTTFAPNWMDWPMLIYRKPCSSYCSRNGFLYAYDFNG